MIKATALARNLFMATFAALTPSAASTAQQLGGAGTPVPFLTAMTGEWDVDQTMWTGPEAKPVKLPAAIAVRRLADGGGSSTSG